MQRRAFLWYLSLWIAGCSAARTVTPSSTQESLVEPTLKLAITDVQGLEPLNVTYDEFREALSAVLGTEIEFFPVENYTSASVALTQGEVDLALTGPSEYVVIRSRTNAVPVIAISRPNYRSVIAVPEGSPIRAIADLRGKTIALSDIGSTSGHLGPTKLMIDAGLDPKADVEIRMLGDEGSVDAIKQGEVDAWGGSAIDYADMLQHEIPPFPIIAEGPPLPSDVLIASSHLEPTRIDQMRQRLVEHQDRLVQALALHETKYVGSRLLPANDADYDPIRQVYEAIGQGEFLR